MSPVEAVRVPGPTADTLAFPRGRRAVNAGTGRRSRCVGYMRNASSVMRWVFWVFWTLYGIHTYTGS